METIDQWHDFFVMVGGASAALTGLVFVALSLNLEAIVKDITHKSRAIGTLTGFTSGFMISSFALMSGQDQRAFGIEWLLIAFVAGFIYLNGAFEARKRGASLVGLQRARLIFGTSIYIVELIGALMFTLGNNIGMYIAAASLIILLAYTVTGAWLLVVGVCSDKSKQYKK